MSWEFVVCLFGGGGGEEYELDEKRKRKAMYGIWDAFLSKQKGGGRHSRMVYLFYRAKT